MSIRDELDLNVVDLDDFLVFVDEVGLLILAENETEPLIDGSW